MSKTTKVLDIQLDGFHLTAIRINDGKELNPFRVYREWNGGRRQIAKCGDFMSVLYFIRDLYQDGADTFTVFELVDWAKSRGCFW